MKILSIGEQKLTFNAMTIPTDSFSSELVIYIQYPFDEELEFDDIFKALEDSSPSFSAEGEQCGCVHDCCGCVQASSASIERLDSGNYVVTQNLYRNV